jgi:hypothetical protein
MKKWIVSALLLIAVITVVSADDVVPLKAGDFGMISYYSKYCHITSGGIADSTAAIGMEYYLLDTFGIRGSFFGMYRTEDYEIVPTGTQKEKEFEYGLSAFPFYECRFSNAFYLDIGVNLDIRHMVFDHRDNTGSFSSDTYDLTRLQLNAFAQCSVKYLLGNGLGVFTDFGIGYSWACDNSTSSPASSSDGQTYWNLALVKQANFGLVFYFR